MYSSTTIGFGVPGPVCTRPCVYQALCVPGPMCTRPSVYQAICVPGPVHTRPCVYQAQCAPGPMFDMEATHISECTYQIVSKSYSTIRNIKPADRLADQPSQLQPCHVMQGASIVVVVVVVVVIAVVVVVVVVWSACVDVSLPGMSC